MTFCARHSHACLIWSSALAILSTPWVASASSVMVSAHRGYAAIAPENTMAAFLAAYEAGADAIELDIKLTLDDQLVVIHDKSLERTTNCTGDVADQPYDYIATCDAGSWFDPSFAGEGVPLFLDVLQEFAGLPVELFVELKAQIPSQQIKDLIDATGTEDQITFLSFIPGDLRDMREVMGSDTTTQNYWLLPYPPRGIITRAHKIREFDGISVNYKGLREDLVDLAWAYGLAVNAWTVDSPEAMEDMIDMGVDSITTNEVEKALAL